MLELAGFVPLLWFLRILISVIGKARVVCSSWISGENVDFFGEELGIMMSFERLNIVLF